MYNHKKKKKIPSRLRFLTWRKHFITMDGFCIICTHPISVDNFTCGHVISEYHGGELAIDNLEPICLSCNSSMNTANLYEYKNSLAIPNKYYIEAEKRITKSIFNHLYRTLDSDISPSYSITSPTQKTSNKNTMDSPLPTRCNKSERNQPLTKKRRIGENNHYNQLYINNIYSVADGNDNNNNDNNLLGSKNYNENQVKAVIFDRKLNEFNIIYRNISTNNAKLNDEEMLNCDIVIRVLWMNILYAIITTKFKTDLDAAYNKSYIILNSYRQNNTAVLLNFYSKIFKKLENAININNSGLKNRYEQDIFFSGIRTLFLYHKDYKKRITKIILKKWYNLLPNSIINTILKYVESTIFEIVLLDKKINEWKSKEFEILFKIFNINHAYRIDKNNYVDESCLKNMIEKNLLNRIILSTTT